MSVSPIAADPPQADPGHGADPAQMPTVGTPRHADPAPAEGPHEPAEGGHDGPRDIGSSGEWLGLAEAAERLGCSVDTLRRRIKRQEVEARQVATKHGPAWQLRLGPRGVQTVSTTVGSPRAAAAAGPQSADGQHAEGEHADPWQDGRHAAGGPHAGADRGPEPVALELVRLVDRLQRENLFLAGQVGFLQAKLQTAEDTVRFLQAPDDDAPEDPPVAVSEPPDALEETTAAAPPAQGAADEAPGWWRRVLAWLQG